MDVTRAVRAVQAGDGSDAGDSGDREDEKESAAITRFRSECDANAMRSLAETTVCHEAAMESIEKNDDLGVGLRLGCHIASVARRAVRETLGFTLSAGISTSKLVAKLAASHGKPNGQVTDSTSLEHACR